MKFSFPKGRRTIFFGATLALLLTAAVPAIALAAPQDTTLRDRYLLRQEVRRRRDRQAPDLARHGHHQDQWVRE